MKLKVVTFLLTACVLALVAWYVQRSGTPDAEPPHPAAPPGEDERKPAVPEDGPDPSYQETLQKGLDFLAKHQHKDGHWEGDIGQHPVVLTALAGLALDLERSPPARPRRFREFASLPKEGTRPAMIRKAAIWLIDRSPREREGPILSEHASETSRYMQGHGLATLFLAGTLQGHDGADPKHHAQVTDVLVRAVQYIVKAQSSQGGWYHTSKVEGHDLATISATVVQIQALQAAENAGIPIPGATAVTDAQEYLKTSLAKSEGRATDIAAALASFRAPSIFGGLMRGSPDNDELKEQWLKVCQAEIRIGRDLQFGRDEPTHFYYAQGLLSHGGAAWKSYRTATFHHLKTTQNQDGSWPGGNGISPIHATALWCVVLQLEKENYPAIQRMLGAVE